jgi:hypothetical protein
MIVLQSLVSLALASLITWLELVTSQYPRTFGLMVKKSWALWVYPLVYGLLAFLVMLAVGFGWSGIKVQGWAENSPWSLPIAIGLSTKALLHISLFNVSVGSQSFPVGTESLVRLFEPWLLRAILLDEHSAVEELINPRANKYPDLASVKTKIKNHIPQRLPKDESKAFEVDIDQSTSVAAAMELYLRAFGRKVFDQIFPE